MGIDEQVARSTTNIVNSALLEEYGTFGGLAEASRK
jgi:hypothetical protein